MNPIGVPDLLTNGQTARNVSRVSQDLARVSQELSSGLKSNLVEASGGDPTRLYSLERELRLNEVRQFSVSQAQGRSGVTQAALGQVQATVSEFGPPLLAAVSLNDANTANIIAGGARSAFSEMVSALNSRFGDRSLFAGAGTGAAALADADTILAEVGALVGGAADAAEALTLIDDYFNDPTGFAATGFLGSPIDAPDVRLDDGERISFAVRADAPEIRAALSSLAAVVVGAEGGFADDSKAERQLLLGAAGRRVIAATDQIINLRSGVGVAEERLDEAAVRVEAQESMLQQARSSIIARDPFEAATELTAVETQVQAIFSITARLSGLTLANFLR